MLRDAESKLTLLAPESSPRVPWVAKIFGPAKPLLSRVGDRQPVQQTLVVPQRQCLQLVVGLALHRSLPPTRGTTTRTKIVPHTTKIRTALLVVAYPPVLFTKARRRRVRPGSPQSTRQHKVVGGRSYPPQRGEAYPRGGGLTHSLCRDPGPASRGVAPQSCFDPSGMVAPLSDLHLSSCSLLTSVPVKYAPLKSALLRSAPLRLVGFRWSLLGSISLGSAPFDKSGAFSLAGCVSLYGSKLAPASKVPLRLAPLRSASPRSLPLRSAPVRLASLRSASLRQALCRVSSLRSAVSKPAFLRLRMGSSFMIRLNS